MTDHNDQEYYDLGQMSHQNPGLSIDHLNSFSDPFDMIYHTLSNPEKEMVATGRFQLLAIQARQIKGIYAAHSLKGLSIELTQIYIDKMRDLEIIEERIRGMKYERYAMEFGHRRAQIFTKNIERLEAVVVDAIIGEVGRDVYPEKKSERGFLQWLKDKVVGPDRNGY